MVCGRRAKSIARILVPAPLWVAILITRVSHLDLECREGRSLRVLSQQEIFQVSVPTKSSWTRMSGNADMHPHHKRWDESKHCNNLAPIDVELNLPEVGVPSDLALEIESEPRGPIASNQSGKMWDS